ncbi:MAG: SufS family cysteine desulfurase [Kiritimatiellae bacterium]|nr:SufS family cysteine desulfurase [Kiritimatiellia bacterium]
MSCFNANTIRSDFPVLDQILYDGKPLAYLDNAATTQKPHHVIHAVQEYYEAYNSNVHRALHFLAERATVAYEETRKKVVSFIHANTERSIIYTRGTTESINLVAYSWGRKNIDEGDEIILSEMEHHSNLVPWQILAQEKKAKLCFIPVLEDGTLDLNAYTHLLSSKTKLVAITHMSNVLGTINPVQKMIDQAHQAGALVLLDGAQSVPHVSIDVSQLDVDFLAFSGHKMLGPTGIGILYGKEAILESMPPFHGGGEMIHKVELEQSTYTELPHKFEAGTPNIAGVIGFGEAIDYLEGVGMGAVQSYEQLLTQYALSKLEKISGLTIIGKALERGGAISFTCEGIHPHDLSQYLDREGVAIRGGHMCCQPLVRKFDSTALNRLSLYLYNMEQDIDQLIEALLKAKEFFKT